MTGSDQYEVVEKIGHGSFGVINKVRRKQDGQILCRKEISYVGLGKQEKEQFIAELQILSSLRHPNIVAYYHREHIKLTQELHMYMEYCGNGDLGRVIRNLKAANQYAEEDFVWSIFSQLVTALYRCHYGVDPPEVGRNVTVTGNAVKPRSAPGAGRMMILHRDLKPDNVFLGEDNSVKLGDFGLSKVISSHDFASTYVGTPFYMSPEICASELYTSHSDIWSLGCVMHELCAREPPFNAKNHFTLVQKIKEGRAGPLPTMYSPELQRVIRSCLQLNPRSRPDTAALLNLPVVRLMRKEREVVELGRVLRAKQDLLNRHLAQAGDKERNLQKDYEQRRRDLDASLRREWEVKAQLEINRRYQEALDHLRRQFESEVQGRVEIEVQRILPFRAEDAARSPEKIPSSSVNSQDDTDFPSTTDLSALSLESPVQARIKPPPLNSRASFSRSRTMFVGSTMDVQMADSSPMALASLSLSPRRNSSIPRGHTNIFPTEVEQQHLPGIDIHPDADTEEGSLLPPSPTQQRTATKGAKAVRPRLMTQKTAPALKPNARLSGAGNAAQKLQGQEAIPALGAQQRRFSAAVNDKIVRGQNKAPVGRRVSHAPTSITLLANESGSPVRQAKRPSTATQGAENPESGGQPMFRAVTTNNMMKGRTLVELAQARAGPVATTSKATEVESTSVEKVADVVWDPEVDEMPSPFLARGKRAVRNL